MKIVIPIAPCPWCRKTPKFRMYLALTTWTPKLQCENEKCLVKPESKYISIRKKQRYNPEIIKQKIEKMISQWNTNAPYNPYEGFEFDFEEIAAKELSLLK